MNSFSEKDNNLIKYALYKREDIILGNYYLKKRTDYMTQTKILWVDDEIELLKPHILFLESKGFSVTTANSGNEAIDILNIEHFDIMFLDENMPGITGLETLATIKVIQPNLPVVMITKSEEESIMEDAIGSNISDYLIKPVNPHQILLSLKKNLEKKKLRNEKATISYQQEFSKIGLNISNRLDFKGWEDIYKKLVYWELELDSLQDDSISEIQKMQKNEANNVFCRYFENNYRDWISGKSDEKPVLSHTLLKDKLFPILKSESKPVFLILIDNLRYDQWKSLQPIVEEHYRTVSEDLFYSIIPSVTQYSRNAIFSGLMPAEIEKRYPQYWNNENDEGSKNQYEKELLDEHLKRYGLNIKTSYNKITHQTAGKRLTKRAKELMSNQLNVIIYNFIDTLSHSRTEMEIIKELAEDESAYRSITQSWFEHSHIKDIIEDLAREDITLIITTDHGSIKVQNPVKVIGDKNTNTNLRYKNGRNLSFDHKSVFSTRTPEDLFLPKNTLSSSFAFCRNNDFFAYPNNYNYYANYYKNSFQHGGISLEEILVPFVVLKRK